MAEGSALRIHQTGGVSAGVTYQIADDPLFRPGEAVVWMSVVGGSANGGTLTKTAATGWGNAGAISSKVLPSGDGYVEFTVSEVASHRILGLSNGNTNSNWDDIEREMVWLTTVMGGPHRIEASPGTEICIASVGEAA